MTTFTGTDGNDTANAATGEIVGFTGGTQAELQDGIGDTITGSGGDDFIFAANANDRIEGGDGFDLLNGGEGNDSIYANTQSDVDGSIIGDELTGNVGHDSLYGSSGADTLIGSDGGDYLNGGAGADVLEGGNDDDFFDLSSGDIGAGETLDGGAGSGDTIQVGGNLNFTAANIAGMEWLFFAPGAGATFSAQQIKNGFGSSLLLYSSTQIGSTSETLRIEMGAETSLSLTLNAILDTLGGGWSSEDRVNIIGDSNGENISCSVSLSNSGFIPIRMFGNGGNDTLTGGNGPDLLAGGVGNDVLNGGVGSDTLIGGVGIDTMSWAGFAVAITFTLPDGGEGLTPVFGGLGEDYFVSIENLTGGSLGDRLTGNSTANTLRGLEGNDRLNGGGGADQLRGGVGNDIYTVNVQGEAVEALNQGTDTVRTTVSYALSANLERLELLGGSALSGTGNALNNRITGSGAANILNGLQGNDTLAGKGGADKFDFTAALGAGNVDTITDFAVGVDSIRIDNAVFTGLAAGALPNSQFHIGTVAGDGNDHIIYNSANGKLFFDVDGTGSTAQVRFATLDAGLALSAGDFLVI